MPIYEYKCQQCAAQVEVRQSVSDEPLTTCEKCHGKLEKQWSLSGFQFKGAGWYVTDYAGKKADKTAGTGEKSSSKESTTPDASASKSASESTSTPSDAGAKSD